MTPKQQKIWLLMKPGKSYSRTEIGKLAGIKSDLAYSFLRGLMNGGYATVQDGPEGSRPVYMRTSLKPKISARKEASRPRGDVWIEAWPHADPVLVQAMRAMIREGAPT